MPFYVNACHELGIEVLPPDVNESMTDFAVVERQDPLRPQRRQGRGGGRVPRRSSPRARRTGRSSRSGTSPSASTRSVSNKRVLEALVKCGALPGSRKAALEVLEQAVRLGQQYQADRLAGQGSIFDLGADRGEARASIRRSRPTSSRRASCCGSRRRCSGCTSPSIRCRGSATSCGASRTRRSASSTAAATARSSRSAASSRALRHMTTKRGDAMVFLRHRGRHRRDRDGRLQLDLREGARAVHDRPRS